MARKSDNVEVETPSPLRRSLVLGGGVAAGVAVAGKAFAQTRTDTGPDTLNGMVMP